MAAFFCRQLFAYHTKKHYLCNIKPISEMTPERLHNLLLTGETVAVEFKRCSGNIESDVYETVCSFLNRFGGDIILGVSDKGEVEGVSKNAARAAHTRGCR